MIHSAKTVEVRNRAGKPEPMITIAANAVDASTLDQFVKDVAQRFLMQRMISPPTTRLLLITIVGTFDSRRFAHAWRQAVGRDAALSAFMSVMQRADLVHGTADGKVLSTTSLLPPAVPR